MREEERQTSAAGASSRNGAGENRQSLVLLALLILAVFLLVEDNLSRAILNAILGPGSDNAQAPVVMAPPLRQLVLFCLIVSVLTIMVALITWQDMPALRPKARTSALFGYVCVVVYFGAQPGIPPLMPYIETIVRLWCVLTAVAVLFLCAAWTDSRGHLTLRWRQVGTGLVLAAAAAAPLGEFDIFWLGAVTGGLLLPIFALSLYWLLVHAAKGLRPFAEAAVLGLALAWVAHIAFKALTGIETDFWGLFQVLGPIPFLVMACGAFSLALYQRGPEEKEDLALVIDEQRQALAEQRQRLEEEKRMRILLEERGRLTRDVHDGIGGQITSLLVRVRNKSVDPAELEAELQSGLQDLRLIVDSLDLENADFVAAMHSFHARIEPQLKAADVALNWSMDAEDMQEIELGAEDVLSVFRFLQEAVANTIKHSQADLLEVSIKRLEDQGKLEIFLQDNGVGFDPNEINGKRGKGLQNMERRAARLGGKLHIASGGAKPGTRVLLSLDVPSAEPRPHSH